MQTSYHAEQFALNEQTIRAKSGIKEIPQKEETHMNVSGGLWSTLARARSFSLGVAMAFSAASLVGHMGSWFPHTRLGLREVVTCGSSIAPSVLQP